MQQHSEDGDKEKTDGVGFEFHVGLSFLGLDFRIVCTLPEKVYAWIGGIFPIWRMEREKIVETGELHMYNRNA